MDLAGLVGHFGYVALYLGVLVKYVLVVWRFGGAFGGRICFSRYSVA